MSLRVSLVYMYLFAVLAYIAPIEKGYVTRNEKGEINPAVLYDTAAVGAPDDIKPYLQRPHQRFSEGVWISSNFSLSLQRPQSHPQLCHRQE